MEKERKLAGQIEALSFSLNLTLLKGRFYLKILQKTDLFWIMGNLQVDHLYSVLYKTWFDLNPVVTLHNWTNRQFNASVSILLFLFFKAFLFSPVAEWKDDLSGPLRGYSHLPHGHLLLS